MSLADVTSARSSPAPPCPECDATASVTSDLHKYQVACTCKPGSVQYACADEPGPPPPAKTDTPPALPPRPPTSVLAATNRRNNSAVGCNGQDATCRRRKYAWWCVGCGALAAALGGLLAAQHILVRAYTASPHHLETVPAAVPAAMLVLTGVCIMSLARRRNRYSYMIKVVGACCLLCALTCVLVTITTTVIHMNKLQTLKFCEYTKLTRTCTCFSMAPDQHSGNDEGSRCVFEGVSECGVVHGALYWCLRGVFALSVSAVLVCICCCMLSYQLLSHERKKMYWEQLELRCRSLYRAPPQPAAPATPGQNNCSCCTQCHPTQPAWDISLQHRFWAPGRIGNLYSPNPGTGRKTSAWSWFPWPRSNSQNSRHRVGAPQSGDSAYGFCETEVPQQYEGNYPEGYRHNFTGQQGFQGQANFPVQQSFPQQFPQQPNFPPTQYNYEGESGSYDAQTGVWGPPPPYSPQGRNGSRHHLHQDPATATLLHHHHMDTIHTHTNIHTCARNYMHNTHNTHNNRDLTRADINRVDINMSDLNRPELRADLSRSERPDLNRSDLIRSSTEIRGQDMRGNADIMRANQEMMRVNPDIVRANPDLLRANPELVRANPELIRANPELIRANAELIRANPELIRANPEMGHMMQYPEEMMQGGRFNTLRGHLVPYRCQRIGLSASNLHRDCRMDDNVAIDCMHQKSASKVSDQSSDSCQKQGKENLGFQNDKHSPIRSSMQDCRALNQNAESEVYFADVSSCCNVSIKAECCLNPNVSALVGTIESHPESTSESEGSFTLTRQQRPQPQVGSKRRPKHNKDKLTHKLTDKRHPNSSVRLTEHQIEQLNMRMNERLDRNEMRTSERNDSRDRLNDSRIIDSRVSDGRIDRNDSRDRLNDSRNELDRLNDSRISDRINETRLSERISERLNDSRFERMNDSRISERLNDSRLDRMNDSRVDRMNDSRISDRLNETRISERINRLNDSDRTSDRMNESRHSDRMNDSRHSERTNESRINERLNESRRSDRMNDSRIERMTDLNSSIRIEGSPKNRSHLSPLRMRTSPKNLKDLTESKPDFFVPPPPVISPLTPNTEESLLSDDDRNQDKVYTNDPETSKRLGPDAKYEGREEKEVFKGNHHHSYSDTNTMDSGWQSGSEKQVTD